jgi:hypothetical protein
MSASSGRLQYALKKLREQWDISQESWSDNVSREFEKHHIIPLEQITKNSINGMEQIAEVLAKVKAQCRED